MEEVLVEFIGGPLDGTEEMELREGSRAMLMPLLMAGHEEGLYVPVRAPEGVDYAMKWVTSCQKPK